MSAPIDPDAYFEPPALPPDDLGVVEVTKSRAIPVSNDDPDVVYDDLRAPAEVIVKKLKPARGMGVADLDQAFVQQKLLAAGARHWAPVLRTGPHGDGIYIATPYFPRSVQKILSQREPVPRRQLYEIILGVLKGLAELKKVAGRPHGNLKASNVLLDGGRVREKKVRLTDPAPTVVASSRGYGADLYRVGELIHQLVLFRPPRGPDAIPVRRSPEWERLGRSGDRWRELCNFLLSPQTDRAGLRIVDVARKLRGTYPRPLLLRPGTLAVFVAAVGVASYLAVREYRGYAQEWDDLRAARGWIEPFESGVRARRAALAVDPDLRDRVLPLFDPTSPRHVDLAPPRPASGGGTRLPFLPAGGPPLQWQAYRHTRAAAAALAQLHADLAPDRWTSLGSVVSRVAEIQRHGLVRLPQYLKGISVAIESGPSGETPEQMEQVIQVRAALDRMDLAQLEIERHAAVLARLGAEPPLVVGLVEPIRRELLDAVKADIEIDNVEGVRNLAGRQELAARRGGGLVTALPVVIELAARQETFESRRWLGPAQAMAMSIERLDPADPQTVEALSATQDALARIDPLWETVDNRRRVLSTSGDPLLASYGRHVTDALATSLTTPGLAPLLESLRALAAESEWAAAELFVKTGQWDRVDKARFQASSKAHRSFANRPVAKLGDVRSWLAEVVDPAYHLGPGSPASRAAVATAMIPGVPIPSPGVTPPVVHPPVIYPPAVDPPAETPAVGNPAVGDPAASPQLASALPPPIALPRPPVSPPSLPVLTPREARDVVGRQLILGLGNMAGIESTVRERIDGVYKGWLERHTAALQARADLIAKDAKQLQQLLSQGDTFEPPPVAGTTPAPGADGRATAAALLASLQSTATGRNLLAPLAPALRAIESGDAAALRSVAGEDTAPLGLRLTAWNKLVETTPPPRAAFEQEAEVFGELVYAAGQVAAEPRRAALRAEIEQGFGRRWRSFLAAATTPGDMGFGLSLRDRYGPLDPKSLDPVTQFDVLLLDTRAAVTAAATAPKSDTAALPAAQDLVKRLAIAAAALPPDVRSPKLTAVVETLRVAATVDARGDFSQLGPLSPAARQKSGGRISWKAEPDPDGNVVTYREVLPDAAGGSEISIVFRRIEADGGAFYLCTTETSLGLFSNVVTQTNQWGELKSRKLLWNYDPFTRDPRPGPRVWEWSRSGRRDEGIVRALVWLSPDWLPDGVDHYPEGIGQEFNRTALRPPTGERPDAVSPSRRMPMQMVSPAAATFFGELVGCRLPTPAEWKAAYAREGKPAGANLRDRTWKMELDHLARSSRTAKFRPDAGMFVPAGEASSDDVWKMPEGGDYDDGLLWFREVVPAGGSPLTFQHLAGNVCEFVQDAAGKVSVIGASALSPPYRPIDKAFEVDPTAAGNGYSDVGFRLAFSAPLKPADRLTAALPEAGWVLVHPAPVPKSAQ